MKQDSTPSGTHAPASVETQDAKSSGCLGALLGFLFWFSIWLAGCFLVFWKLGQTAAAVAFFVPPLALMLWAMFSKPPGTSQPPLDPNP